MTNATFGIVMSVIGMLTMWMGFWFMSRPEPISSEDKAKWYSWGATHGYTRGFVDYSNRVFSRSHDEIETEARGAYMETFEK